MPSKIEQDWQLQNDVRLVTGASRGALYHLTEGKVYSINQLAIDIITEKTSNDLFWKSLSDLNLASKTESKKENVMTPPEVNLSFVWLELTDQCNHRCLHCYGNFGAAVIKPDDRLTFPQWKNIVEQIKSENVKTATLIGGEPDMYRGSNKNENSYNLMQFMKQVGIDNIEYFTNATLLNDQKIKILKDLDISVALSLYALDPIVHDTITQTPGSFTRTMKAIDLLRKYEVPIRVAVVVMKQNESSIPMLMQWLKEEHLLLRMPDVVRLDESDKNHKLLPSLETNKTYGLTMKPDFTTNYSNFYRNQLWHSCLAGKLSVNSDGSVLPCVFDRKNVLGNIKNHSIQQIVQSERTQKIWHTTKDIILVCKDCEYRYACGDCRPISAGKSGNYLAPYSRCTYNPYTGEWANGIWQQNKQEEPKYILLDEAV